MIPINITMYYAKQFSRHEYEQKFIPIFLNIIINIFSGRCYAFVNRCFCGL